MKKYGWRHEQERARVSKDVDAGYGWCCEIVCLMPSRWIPPGSRWHLAHTPDGSSYLGPAHALCNTSEAGRRGNAHWGNATKFDKARKWKRTTDWLGKCPGTCPASPATWFRHTTGTCQPS